jgi:phage gp29-like protein
MIAQCANDLSRAMREEYYTDPQGRQVRVKHAARYEDKPENGDLGQQKTLWDDIRTADYDHMARAFALRRRQIVGECKQLKTDIDSYNDINREGKKIQTIFDFRDDIEDAEQPTDYKPNQPR